MRTTDFVEKRKYKRLDLSLPMKIWYITSIGGEDIQEGFTINVSFSGAYVRDITFKDIKPEDRIKISLTVPRDDTRDFPFSRFIGKAKVKRVEDDGVAVEFGEDINRLFVAPN